MNNICSEPACPIILDSTCVFYTGATLIYTGVNTNDNLQIVLQKIDAKFRDAGLGYVFTNGLIQTAPGQPVKLGGVLVNNTTINSQGFTFGLSGTIGSSAFITTGGTSSQFVKGDGSLDNGPYQPSGNYITALTGDGTASGPGSSVLTLATVFNAPATYGSSTRVPIITVNEKGLVTNVTTTIISVPSSSISINGDVYGYGNTGVPFNLTLANVLATPGIYGSATSIPVINVNSKGLITSISQVAISGGGGSGTVSSVSVTPGTGISASVATPTTTPNITITNTAPDQVVTLANGTGISVTGTYPNFTIAATGGSIPTLQQVLTAGNSATTSIDIINTNIAAYNTGVTNLAGLSGGSGSITLKTGGTNAFIYASNLSTTDKTIELPDSTGTLAMSVNGVFAGIDGSITIPVGTGTVTSVDLTMPSAFTVTGNPVTTSGTIAVTGAGLVSQYVRGDGTLANFPNSTGGGASVNYYLNGSVSQGTFGGDTYYQMSKTPVLGAGTNFIRTNGAGPGYIASFITDAGDPNQLNIPGGNWNLEFYFNSSASGGSPSFYAELYKVDLTNVFTLIASGSANPENITNGTAVDQYFTSLPVPQTTLLATDRLAIRIFVTTGGRTITLHTENGNLAEVLTTFTTGLTALNGLTAQVQNFVTGTSGTDFGISSTSATHTFNLPDASATARGVITTGAQTIAGQKTFSSQIKMPTTGSNLILQILSDGTIASMATTTYPSPTELSYVKGVTSSIQTQIGTKQATITGAATTITSSDLTASRALISNASGKVAVSTVTDTELGYVSGVTSGIQNQINSKGYTLPITSTAGNLGTGATYYFGNLGRAITTTADISRVYIPKTGVIKKAYIVHGSSTTGTITSITVSIRLNNTTDTLVAVSTASSVFRTYINNSLSISVTEGDYIEMKVTSVSSSPPGSNTFSGTLYIE